MTRFHPLSAFYLCWRRSRSKFTFGRQMQLFILLVLIFLIGFLLFSSQFSLSSTDSGELTFHSSNEDDDVQYAVVIDAGSSGSRVYIYTWPPHTGNPNELLKIRPLTDKTGEPIVKKIEPGLSSIATEPQDADNYLFPLLQFASQQIPSRLHVETPLFILATAGLRLLNSSQQSSIIEDLRTDIPKNFNFSLASNNVELISGKQEAVYQWIAINYVLERFSHNLNSPLIAVDIREDSSSSSESIVFRKQTVGILDMGGASMQIGFEITQNFQLKSLHAQQRSQMAEFNLGCMEHGIEHLFHVYVTTYLGLGANEVLEFYEKTLVSSAFENSLTNGSKKIPTTLIDPCLPNEMTHSVPIIQTNFNGTITVRGSGKFDLCRNNLMPILKNLTGCPGAACIFSSLPNNFANFEWYGFSEFWYSMEDVLKIGGNYNFYRVQKASKDFCNTKWSILQNRHERGHYPLADKNRLRNQCFKMAWITVILHVGLLLPFDYSHLRSSPNSIAGQVVHWTLGATLFRTRFFPLGAVQRELLSQRSRPVTSVFFYWNHYLFLGCFLLVIAAILSYLRGLRVSFFSCFKKRRNNNSIFDHDGQFPNEQLYR